MTPASRIAAISSSGMPQRPKPPAAIGHAVEEQPVERGGGVVVDLRFIAMQPLQIEASGAPLRRRHRAFVLFAELDDAPDQRAFEGASVVAVEAEVVLETGPRVAAGGDAPFVEDDLVRPDSGAAPFGVRGEALERLDVEVEYRAIDRHRVLHAHDELHVERGGQPPSSAISAARKMWLRSKASISGLTP